MATDCFDHLFIAPADFDRAVAFYRDSLGWSTVASWGGENQPRGLILNGGAIKIVLAERHDTADHSWSHGINEHRPTVHLTVENLDERYRELSAVAEVAGETRIDPLGYALVRGEGSGRQPDRL